MILLALIAALQVAPDPPANPEPGQPFSILADTAPPCPVDADGKDVIVCGRKDQERRLPLPDERGPPDGPVPSNPYLRPDVALNAGVPCSVHLAGCNVGFGPPIVPIIKGLVGAVKNTFAGHPDKSGRVAIPLDEPDRGPSRIDP